MLAHRRQSHAPFFNLSLLDVVCNALGAIIFLMFLGYWQAHHVSHRLQASLADLATKQAALTQRENALQQARKELSDLLNQLGVTQKQLATTQHYLRSTEKARLAAQQTAEELRVQLHAEQHLRQLYQQLAGAWEQKARDLEVLAADAANQLRQRQQEREQLAAEFMKLDAQRNQLSVLLKLAQEDLARSSQQNRSLQEELTQHRARIFEYFHAWQMREAEIQSLQTRLSELDKERFSASALAAQLQKNLLTAEAREKLLTGDLARSQKAVEELTREYEKLAQEREELAKRLATQRLENQRLSEQLVLAQRQIGEVQKQSEKLRVLLQQAQTRFAGVDLSGRRAVFLVDTSGSMGKRDPNTDDATKWPRVCETVRHVLLSMPNLEQFQLITFASTVNYPLGQPGLWQTYDRDHSPLEVFEVLRRIRPEGGTNLHLGFQEAFRYRPLGLDTIILFSDGLPTESPDLTAEEQRLENKEREQRLAPRLLRRIAEWNAPRPELPQRVRIHAVGFYYDSPNLGNFLWALVRQNDGTFVGMSEP
ncbi:MAG: VWA domain-containing protein [Gemmatales bacterium]|nr:VWA domain-containing protein [Gemmatales bacterium]MDW8175360.1 VWA domain-containing protein [Gemmatales bacterium]